MTEKDTEIWGESLQEELPSDGGGGGGQRLRVRCGRGFRTQKRDCPATTMGEEMLASAGGPRVCYSGGRHKQDVPALGFYGGTSETLKAKSAGLARPH